MLIQLVSGEYNFQMAHMVLFPASVYFLHGAVMTKLCLVLVLLNDSEGYNLRDYHLYHFDYTLQEHLQYLFEISFYILFLQMAIQNFQILRSFDCFIVRLDCLNLNLYEYYRFSINHQLKMYYFVSYSTIFIFPFATFFQFLQNCSFLDYLDLKDLFYFNYYLICLLNYQNYYEIESQDFDYVNRKYLVRKLMDLH